MKIDLMKAERLEKLINQACIHMRVFPPELLLRKKAAEYPSYARGMYRRYYQLEQHMIVLFLDSEDYYTDGVLLHELAHHIRWERQGKKSSMEHDAEYLKAYLDLLEWWNDRGECGGFPRIEEPEFYNLFALVLN